MNRSIIVAALIVSGAILLNGYLDRVSSRPPTAPAASKHKPAPIEKSIAILPFADLGAPENASVADDVQETVLAALAKSSDLKVVSRTAVMRYKSGDPRDLATIGKELGVAHILEGTVWRTGNNVRVSVQLVDTATDSHLWADRYDRATADLPEIESEIAKEIVRIVRAR